MGCNRETWIQSFSLVAVWMSGCLRDFSKITRSPSVRRPVINPRSDVTQGFPGYFYADTQATSTSLLPVMSAIYVIKPSQCLAMHI